MVLGLFKDKCKICGEKIDKGSATVSHGKSFCSEKHAEEYREKLAAEEKPAKKGGGCCG